MPINQNHRFQIGKTGSISLNILAPKIQNLVIEGAGTRGPVGAGAIDTLEHRGVLTHVKRVAGSSAGASIATLLALGYKSKEIKDYVDNFNFNELKDIAPPTVSSTTKKIFHFMYNVCSKKRGIYKGKKLLEEIRKLIHDKIKKTLSLHQDKKMLRVLKKIGLITTFENGEIKLANKITFKHLDYLATHYAHLGFKNLFITGTNTTQKRLEIFSNESEPDMEIALAVRISMSIPWIFKQVRYKNNLYMDGGCLNNFPMNIFDNEKYYSKENIKSQGENHQNLCTLGIKIDTKNEMSDILWQRTKPNPAKLKKLGKAIANGTKNCLVGVKYVQATQQSSQETYDKYSQRVIQGYDEGIGFADFNLDSTKKKALYESGKKAALDWLEIHSGEVLNRERFKSFQQMSDDVLKECHYHLKNPAAKDMFVQLGKTSEQIEKDRNELLTRASQKLLSRNISPLVFFHKALPKSKPVLSEANIGHKIKA